MEQLPILLQLAQGEDRQLFHLLHPYRLRAREPRRQLGQADREESVLVARADALGIDRDGEAEAALERADLHLHRVVVRLALVPRRALAADREDAVRELHREVLR